MPNIRIIFTALSCSGCLLWIAPEVRAADSAELAKTLAGIDTNVLSAEQRAAAVERYTRHFSERIKRANQKSTEDWKKAIGTADAEGIEALFKRSREALRKSLGLY